MFDSKSDRRFLFLTLVFAGSLFFLPAAALAQTVTGTLQGTVSDSKGSVIPGAEVIIRKDQSAIYKHVANANRKLMRLIIRGSIKDRVLIKDHDVCRKAFANQATVAEPKGLRRQRRHFPDRILERNQLQLAHVVAEHSRVVAIAPWMRNAFVVLSDAAVGRDHRKRLLHDALDVVFAHAVINHPGAAGFIHLKNLFYLTRNVGFFANLLCDLSN